MYDVRHMSPLPKDAPPLPQVSARERIYEALKEWIVEGVLEPDEQLKDVELAERFGTSRTPVREALRQLEDEHLVVTARNRWTRVAPLDVEEPGRLLPIMAALETLALRMAWPFSDEDKQRLEDATDTLAKAIERRRAKDALAADLRFHGAFDGCSGNPELIALLGRLRDRMRRVDLQYWARPALARTSVEEHTRIIDAIRAEDLDRAVHALEDHWDHERLFRVADPETGEHATVPAPR
jgi:DNA-binding GntR family transcriptional regulator